MNCHKILPTRNLSHKTSVFASFCSLECLLKDFRIFCCVDATGLRCTGALIKCGFVEIDTTLVPLWIPPEIFIDLQSNLCSTKKSVIQLSILLCQIDSFLEVGVLHDLFQGGSNLRIQHLKIRESTPSS